MGNIEIFAQTSNWIITVLSLVIFSITTLVIRQGKLPAKEGLSYIYLGLLLEFMTIYTTHLMTVEYARGQEIDWLVFAQLFLLLILVKLK